MKCLTKCIDAMHTVILCILLQFEEGVPCTGFNLLQIVECKVGPILVYLYVTQHYSSQLPSLLVLVLFDVAWDFVITRFKDKLSFNCNTCM